MKTKKGVVLLVVAAVAGTASAHEGVQVEIAKLDASLERSDDAGRLLERAALRRRVGKYDDALVDLERALDEEPGRADLVLERALVFEAMGDLGAAKSDLDDYFDAGGGAREAFLARARMARREGDRCAESRWMAQPVALTPDPDVVLERGAAAEACGDLEAAISVYEAGLTALGGARVVRVRLVRALVQKGDLARAEALVDEELRSDRGDSKTELLLDRADVREAAGRVEEARADRNAALAEVDARLAKRPTDLKKTLRARALLALGRKADAVRELEGVVERSPKLDAAHALLSQARGLGR